MTAPASQIAPRAAPFPLLLVFVSGMGGLLYGYDIGIIGAALLYLSKSIDLTLAQESWVVAAVLGGGMISSLVGGGLADLIGRKKVMMAAGALFIVSVGLMVGARSFLPLFLGRGLQGLSAGMIAVVIPLYLAESLPASIRGRGTAAFQLMLTIGIFSALAIGTRLAGGVEAKIAGADPGAIRALQDGAWRAMFRTAFYPGLVFLIGVFLVPESPDWPARLAASATTAASGSLAQRRYIIPFLLTCAVLALNQATGINSVLQFLVVILQQAGLPAQAAARQGSYVTLVNVLFTVVGLLLVDRVGRTALLKWGTAGIVVAFLAAAALFYRFERRSIDVTAAVTRALAHGAHALPVAGSPDGTPSLPAALQLTVVYTERGQERLATGFSNAADPQVRFPTAATLVVHRARLGPVPGPGTARAITFCLMLFIASFATGPGVCVWLALSELMPLRIRSWGMGIGLLLNQGISTAIAAVFLPFVGNFGYAAVFLFWAACTVLYFLTAAFVLPETKGRTLEEIEAGFSPGPSEPGPADSS